MTSPDLDAAHRCAASYDISSIWDNQLTTRGVWWSLTYTDFATCVTFRGSDNPMDWGRDFRVAPWFSRRHIKLGFVHGGFLEGMDDVYTQILPLIKHDLVNVEGHSLGAARATVFCAMLVEGGFAGSIRRVVFGEPREAAFHIDVPGLIRLVQDQHVSSMSYRNIDGKGHHDEVTDAPSWPPFQRPGSLTDCMVPADAPEWTLGHSFILHHMPLYVRSIEAIK